MARVANELALRFALRRFSVCVRDRLKPLSARLGDADWLDGAFSAGNLMMVGVLVRLKSSDLLDEYPNLSAPTVKGDGSSYPDLITSAPF